MEWKNTKVVKGIVSPEFLASIPRSYKFIGGEFKTIFDIPASSPFMNINIPDEYILSLEEISAELIIIT